MTATRVHTSAAELAIVDCGADYWPEDAHGDHTFRFAGVPRQHSCTDCSAVRTW